jgi:predicted nucleic acid-binding protein
MPLLVAPRDRQMILADTSAWVEYDRATGSSVDERLTELITTDGPLMITEPVIMEVLALARSDQDLPTVSTRGGHSARHDRLHDCRGGLASTGHAAVSGR